MPRTGRASSSSLSPGARDGAGDPCFRAGQGNWPHNSSRLSRMPVLALLRQERIPESALRAAGITAAGTRDVPEPGRSLVLAEFAGPQ
jgi:hypothetical protein